MLKARRSTDLSSSLVQLKDSLIKILPQIDKRRYFEDEIVLHEMINGILDDGLWWIDNLFEADVHDGSCDPEELKVEFGQYNTRAVLLEEVMCHKFERFRRVLHRFTAMGPSWLRELRACWLVTKAMSTKSEVLSSVASVLVTIVFIGIATRSMMLGRGYELVRHVDGLGDLLLTAATYLRFFGMKFCRC